MRKQITVGFFIGIQLLLVTLYIHKESTLVKLSYQRQSIQEELKQLVTKKENLTTTLCHLQDPKRVKSFAQEKLGMQPLALKKIKRLPLC